MQDEVVFFLIKQEQLRIEWENKNSRLSFAVEFKYYSLDKNTQFMTGFEINSYQKNSIKLSRGGGRGRGGLFNFRLQERGHR